MIQVLCCIGHGSEKCTANLKTEFSYSIPAKRLKNFLTFYTRTRESDSFIKGLLTNLEINMSNWDILLNRNTLAF